MAGTYRGARVVWNGDALTAAVTAGAVRGLNLAAERLLAIVIPYTPYLNGDLTKAYGIHEATLATAEQGAQLQNSSPYAKRQHEELDYHHTRKDHPDAMAKYVENPMRAAAAELQGIIAASIREGL